MIARIHKYHVVVRQYGLKRCSFRFWHDLCRKTGILKRQFPAWHWDERPLAEWFSKGIDPDPTAQRVRYVQGKTRFFFPPGRFPEVNDVWSERVLSDANKLLHGQFCYFFQHQAAFGFPDPNWHRNPFTGQYDSADRHWCDNSDFDPRRGDIKFLWEPSRFAWAYTLSRAYACSRQEKYAEAFWQLVESWMVANPPQIGVNWQCGQEIAIRAIACAFTLHVFARSPATSDLRWAQMMLLLGASAERIAGNINYARAQMGNHATSEAAALWTIGLLFPEFKEAQHWKELARFVLEDEARYFNWSDGSYAQHSMNYQRLMLHAYLWSMRLAEINGESFSHLVRERLEKSYQFLYQLQDESEGRLPNYGPNDGALMLPLNECDYLDYRPVLGTLHYLFTREHLYDAGPWQEDLVWLFGKDALKAPQERMPRTSRRFNKGGYFVLRGRESWAMVRCHTYRNRPNQADALHVDLWWMGVNVFRDSGTFSYYDPEHELNIYFTSTAAHNTVRVGDQEQMIKGPRFRWYSLLQARFQGQCSGEGMELWQGEHYGYRRLLSQAVHRRAVCRFGERFWLIIDDVIGIGKEETELNWHLSDVPVVMHGPAAQLETSVGIAQVTTLTSNGESPVLWRGCDGAPGVGWESLYYGERTPAPTLRTFVAAELPIRYVTILSLGSRIDCAETDLDTSISWHVSGEGTQARALLYPPGRHDAIVSILEFGGYCWNPELDRGA